MKSDEKKYFYALTDAQEYDATIRLTVPYYDLIHKTLIDVLSYHFGVSTGTCLAKDVDGVFLDIGAGTGTETISILQSFPSLSAIAVDLAAPMKAAFAENYKRLLGSAKGDDRYEYLTMDALELQHGNHINDVTSRFYSQNKVAAVSAYCIHHYPLNVKETLYKKMYDFLDEGGILINVDLFTYASPSLRQQAHHFDIEYIKREFDDPSPMNIHSTQLPNELRHELKAKWLVHMDEDNILDSVESQLDILKKLGFREVECVFRYFQQGIIVGKK